jgi:hypothetical protein
VVVVRSGGVVQTLFRSAFYGAIKSLMSIDSAKKIGRPRVDSEAVNVRLDRETLTLVDSWIAYTRKDMTRPEAIRQLIGIGLSVPQNR